MLIAYNNSIMLYRKIQDRIENFITKKRDKALLVTGARQTGKTFIIREIGKKYKNFVEINFFENKEAAKLFENISSASDILFRLSAITNKTLVKGETLVFFDEVQEVPNLITAIKFLVEDNSYQYILSGSLLGIELKDIASIPVGYMDIYHMYPLDLEEFFIACGIKQEILTYIRKSYEEKTKIDEIIHEKLLSLFHLYLIVGGMPEVVNAYLETNNIKDVIETQKGIIELYRADISKYDYENKLKIKSIFDLIPGELNNQNKRFILKKLNEKARFKNYENSFLWLKDAGVALPMYVVDEPVFPLVLSQNSNLFKLFLCDSGLLSAMYLDGNQLKILQGDISINNGAIYENFIATELCKHGFTPYYLNNRKIGEIDFLIENNGEICAIESKSGRDSKHHKALDNMLSTYGGKGIVLHEGNICVEDKIIYYPAYLVMFLQKDEIEDLIFKVDLDSLASLSLENAE